MVLKLDLIANTLFGSGLQNFIESMEQLNTKVKDAVNLSVIQFAKNSNVLYSIKTQSKVVQSGILKLYILSLQGGIEIRSLTKYFRVSHSALEILAFDMECIISSEYFLRCATDKISECFSVLHTKLTKILETSLDSEIIIQLKSIFSSIEETIKIFSQTLWIFISNNNNSSN